MRIFLLLWCMGFLSLLPCYAVNISGMNEYPVSIHKENINTSTEIGVRYTTVTYLSQRKYELENVSPLVIQRIEDTESRLYQKPQPKPNPFFTYDKTSDRESHYIVMLMATLFILGGGWVVWKIIKKRKLRKARPVLLTEEMIAMRCKALLEKKYPKEYVEKVYETLQQEMRRQ